MHGGFWRVPFGPDLMEPLADDLAGRGVTVTNLSYRRVGEEGGGWPGTFDDVRAGVAAAQPDVVIGHSAGGHLALWAAQFARPRLAVSLGGVVDLYQCYDQHLSRDAVVELLGGSPAEVPERYEAASPNPRAGVRALLVHGADDDIVPVALSESYTWAAGDDAELVVVPGEGHFEPIDPSSRCWAAVMQRVERL